MDRRDLVLHDRRRDIRGPNAHWCRLDHLFDAEKTAANQCAIERVTDVEPPGGLRVRKPAVAYGTRPIEHAQVVRVPQCHHLHDRPRVACSVVS